MKKQINILIVIVLISFPSSLFAQTKMDSIIKDLGNVKIWSMSSNNVSIGKVYTIEHSAICHIVFSPNKSEMADATMVITGTYTSEAMQVAGSAYENCEQIGNEADKYFKPNSYLDFQNGTILFADLPTCNCVQVYKLIDKGLILSDVVNARTSKTLLWRFLVQKIWSKESTNGKRINGVDLMIVDFEKPLTLTEACNYVKGLERKNAKYDGFFYFSQITACLLDTGTYRPFLLNGEEVDGKVPVEQSNVIVIN